MATTLNGVPFENPPYVGDGSLGEASPETSPYANELRQQQHLPPPGDYWLWRPTPTWCWVPARVDNGVPLRGVALIGLHAGETRSWDLRDSAWWTRVPPSLPTPS